MNSGKKEENITDHGADSLSVSASELEFKEDQEISRKAIKL